MAHGVIQYAADPNMVIAVTNQESGASLSIQRMDSNPLLYTWNHNALNGLITLVSSGLQQLSITVPGNNCSGTPVLQIQPAATPVSQFQRWNLFHGGPTFINSVGCPGKCIDLQGRNITPGTPIWLVPCNGSPAQQWIFTAVTTFDLEALTSSNG
jgi:hypothetical protein